MLGSSPGGSRVIRRWGRNRRPGKNLFNYRYRGRLETDSVVGELMEKRRLNNWFTWNTNHHLRRPQASFHSPEEEEALRPPRSDLRSPGRISRLGEYPHSRWEFSHENGEQVNSFSERNGYGGELPVKYSDFGGRCLGTGGFLRLDHAFAYAKLLSS